MRGDDANEANVGGEGRQSWGGQKGDIEENHTLSFTFVKIFGDFPGASMIGGLGLVKK